MSVVLKAAAVRGGGRGRESGPAGTGENGAAATTSAGGGASPPEVVAAVTDIVAAVREGGDAAVRELSARFDRWEPESFRLTPEQIADCVAQVGEQELEDLRWCQQQVRAFARAQRETLADLEVELAPGVRLGHRHVPIARVGAYVPGGRYPMLASAAMTIATAKAAGVEEVVACTPPLDGGLPAVTVAAMHLAGADEIHVLGGVQAVAAMALGTETIAKADFIAGPGNAYVAEAKRQLFGEVGIDLFAGPTEILVVADETADPEIVAADLLGQAEHGPTSPAALISTSEPLARAALEEVERQLATLPTADVAAPAWRDFGEVHVVATREEAAALADAFAYEHVEILTAEPRWFLERMRQYGALFLGEGTTVAYGDKAIGTNHVLPTAGAARYTGGLWVGKFLKTVTYQECDPAASARIGEICARQCRLERFEGHARSCDVRVRKYAGALAGSR